MIINYLIKVSSLDYNKGEFRLKQSKQNVDIDFKDMPVMEHLIDRDGYSTRPTDTSIIFYVNDITGFIDNYSDPNPAQEEIKRGILNTIKGEARKGKLKDLLE